MHVGLLSVFVGGLSLAIEGPSKVEITCNDNKNGLCRVSYVPAAEGNYDVIIKFDDQHIVGSPFKANISGKILLTSDMFGFCL